MPLIDRTPIRDQVYRHLLDSILSGQSQPGLRIRDSELADRLDVSRTPVREALLRLSQEGFLESQPGRGFAVRHLEAEEIHETYPILWTLDELALSLAQPVPESILAELRGLNASLEQTVGDAVRRLDLDAAWHQTLVSGCRNTRLLETIAQLRRVIRRYELAYMVETDLVVGSVRDHAGIVAALEHRDAARAQRLLKEHWKRSLKALTAGLGS